MYTVSDSLLRNHHLKPLRLFVQPEGEPRSATCSGGCSERRRGGAHDIEDYKSAGSWTVSPISLPQ